MSDEVTFDNQDTFRPRMPLNTAPRSRMLDFLIKKGWVKDYKTATKALLIFITAVILASALVLYLGSHSSHNEPKKIHEIPFGQQPL